MGLIYLDACLAIYLVEQHPRWASPLERAMMTQIGIASFAISRLVKCEYLVGPIKRADPGLQRDFAEFFAQQLSLAMPEPVYLQAAELRARFGLRTPDALHLACAQHHRCAALWTNDNRLSRASHGLARNVLGRAPEETRA